MCLVFLITWMKARARLEKRKWTVHHTILSDETQHAEETHTHPYAHTLLFTQNTLIRMRAGGSPFPLWYTDRQAHSDTRTEYLVCNRIRRNLKAQKHSHGAYSHRGGNKLRNSTNKSWGTANTSTSSLSHHFSCFTQTVSLTAGFKLCSVFWLMRGGTYVATGTPSWCGCVLSSPPDSTRCWQ